MANTITVSPHADGAFDVEVRHARGTTHHVVTVPAGLPAALGAPDVEHATLVELSFVFLLEHEPATSIMGRFDLDVISEYFPHYVAEMTARLA